MKRSLKIPDWFVVGVLLVLLVVIVFMGLRIGGQGYQAYQNVFSQTEQDKSAAFQADEQAVEEQPDVQQVKSRNTMQFMLLLAAVILGVFVLLIAVVMVAAWALMQLFQRRQTAD